MSISPWQVQICALNASKNEDVQKTADKLYEELTALGAEVLYDDRSVSIGSMLTDADLFGIPLRIIVSPKTLSRNAVEFTKLNLEPEKTETVDLDFDNAAKTVYQEIKAELEKYNI